MKYQIAAHSFQYKKPNLSLLGVISQLKQIIFTSNDQMSVTLIRHVFPKLTCLRILDRALPTNGTFENNFKLEFSCPG